MSTAWHVIARLWAWTKAIVLRPVNLAQARHHERMAAALEAAATQLEGDLSPGSVHRWRATAQTRRRYARELRRWP